MYYHTVVSLDLNWFLVNSTMWGKISPEAPANIYWCQLSVCELTNNGNKDECSSDNTASLREKQLSVQ